MMLTKAQTALACALVSLCGTAVAAPTFSPYFLTGGSFLFDDSDRGSEAGFGFNLGVGKRFTGRFGSELRAFASNFDNDPPGDPNFWREYGVGADLHLYLSDSTDFAPFLLLGGGIMRSEERATTGNESTDGFGNVGIGATAGFSAGRYRMGVRGDYRYRYVDADASVNGNAFGDHIVSVGLVLPFGAGALLPATAVTTLDSDGDGVPDNKDACPNTPAGVVVDARGCPLDSDGDGVPDYLDKCADTEGGVAVNKEGCPVDQVGANREFETVNFAFDRSDLNERARAILDEASKVIVDLQAQHGGLVIQIDGHTDSIGSPGYNQGLSERRANSVKDYLTRKGVDAKRIETRAFGLTKPIASNETDAGRAQNRRAEVRTRAPQ